MSLDRQSSQVSFAVSVDTDEKTGHTRAAYFVLRSGKSATTKELVEGRVMADYDSDGSVIGIEILGPVTGDELNALNIGERDIWFIRNVIPREFILERPLLARIAELEGTIEELTHEVQRMSKYDQ